MAPIPQSQKNRVRTIARNAWAVAIGDADTAAVIAGKNIDREVGGAWVRDGCELAESLLDYWATHGISEPSAVFIAGEPGCEGWDE